LVQNCHMLYNKYLTIFVKKFSRKYCYWSKKSNFYKSSEYVKFIKRKKKLPERLFHQSQDDHSVPLNGVNRISHFCLWVVLNTCAQEINKTFSTFTAVFFRSRKYVFQSVKVMKKSNTLNRDRPSVLRYKVNNRFRPNTISRLISCPVDTTPISSNGIR